MRSPTTLVTPLALALSLALAGCTGSDDAPSSGSGAGDGALPPPPPEVGACYRLTLDEVTRTTAPSEAVPCQDNHTAVTFHVGRLPLPEGEETVDPESDQVRTTLQKTCPRTMADHLGGSPENLRLSRFQAVWFTPTEEELADGARWFRCDVVALRDDEKLQRLPAPKRLEGVLRKDAGLDRFGLCGTAKPGAKNFRRVICSAQHSWEAVATIQLDGTKYPGRAKARKAGDGPCADTVRSALGDPRKFEYGWEWPTKQQWQGGQRYGYCWAPA